VRLHPLELDASRLGDRAKCLELVDERRDELGLADVDAPPAESLAVGERRVRAEADAVAPRLRHGLAHRGVVAGVSAARHVRGVDERPEGELGFLLARGRGLADVAAQVDGLHQAFSSSAWSRSSIRVSGSSQTSQAARPKNIASTPNATPKPPVPAALPMK